MGRVQPEVPHGGPHPLSLKSCVSVFFVVWSSLCLSISRISILYLLPFLPSSGEDEVLWWKEDSFLVNLIVSFIPFFHHNAPSPYPFSSRCSIPLSLFIITLHPLVLVHHIAPSPCPCSSRCSIPLSLFIMMLHPHVPDHLNAPPPCPCSSRCSIPSRSVMVESTTSRDLWRVLNTNKWQKQSKPAPLSKVSSLIKIFHTEHLVTKAELLYAGHIVEHNMPCASTDHVGQLF